MAPVAKTGPTPAPGASTAVTRRRVDSPGLRATAIALPPPADHWLPATRDSYRDYCASDVARALEEEDAAQVRLLFDYRDRLNRLVDEVARGLVEDEHKAAQTIRIYDGMAARLASELGIGPLARTRLGLTRVQEGSALQKLMGTK